MKTIDLGGQFVLCRNRELIPESWVHKKCGDWWLGCHSTLPIKSLLDVDSVTVGWLLGWPIAPGGQFIETSVDVSMSFSGTGVSTLLEWDANIPAFEEMHAEVLKARQFLSAEGRSDELDKGEPDTDQKDSPGLPHPINYHVGVEAE